MSDEQTNVVSFNDIVQKRNLPTVTEDDEYGRMMEQRVTALGMTLIPFLTQEEPEVALGAMISLITSINLEFPELFVATCEGLDVIFLETFEETYPSMFTDMEE